MLNWIRAIMPLAAWGFDVGLNIMADAIAAASGMSGWNLVWFCVGAAIVITLTLSLAASFIRSRQWPETRSISHLNTKYPIASKRELQESLIQEKTILIERLIGSDNMVHDKSFVRCSFVGPGVAYSQQPWPSSELKFNVRNEAQKEHVVWPVIPGRSVFGGVEFSRCTFKECAMFNLGIALPTTIKFEVIAQAAPEKSAASPHINPQAHSDELAPEP